MTDTPVMTAFGPDFPFAYDQWLDHGAGLGSLPSERLRGRVAIIQAGISGLVCGHELMRLGLHPVYYEAGQLGGHTRVDNPGPGDRYLEIGPIDLPD